MAAPFGSPVHRARAWRLVTRVENAIVVTLLALLAVVLAVSTVQLVVIVVTDAVHRWATVHSVDELVELRQVFSGFLLILIGVELMQTIAMYLREHAVHVEVVLTVGIIAVARHTLDIDYESASAGELGGTAALVLALCGGYYLFRQVGFSTARLAAQASDRHGGRLPTDEAPVGPSEAN